MYNTIRKVLKFWMADNNIGIKLVYKDGVVSLRDEFSDDIEAVNNTIALHYILSGDRVGFENFIQSYQR